MYEPTIITWILIGFGIITTGPLLYAQFFALINPNSKKARGLLIGKGEEWRDNSHFKSAVALTWADWLIFLPLFIAGIVGIIMQQVWGYLFFGMAATIQFYINTFLFFFEKEYVYKSVGPAIYYTYFWGNFMYWSFLTIIYVVLRVSGINF